MTEVTTKENIVDNKARLRSKINARQSVHSQNNQSRFRQIGSNDQINSRQSAGKDQDGRYNNFLIDDEDDGDDEER